MSLLYFIICYEQFKIKINIFLHSFRTLFNYSGFPLPFFQPDVHELRYARRQRERPVAAHHDGTPFHVRRRRRRRRPEGRVRLYVQTDVRHVAAAGHRHARLPEAAGVAHVQRQQSTGAPPCGRRSLSPPSAAHQRTPSAPPCAPPRAPPVQHERLKLHGYVQQIHFISVHC